MRRRRSKARSVLEWDQKRACPERRRTTPQEPSAALLLSDTMHARKRRPSDPQAVLLASAGRRGGHRAVLEQGTSRWRGRAVTSSQLCSPCIWLGGPPVPPPIGRGALKPGCIIIWPVGCIIII